MRCSELVRGGRPCRRPAAWFGNFGYQDSEPRQFPFCTLHMNADRMALKRFKLWKKITPVDGGAES